MRPLSFSINVTLDGCYDHTVGIADEDLHRNAMEYIAESPGFFEGLIQKPNLGTWRISSSACTL